MDYEKFKRVTEKGSLSKIALGTTGIREIYTKWMEELKISLGNVGRKPRDQISKI